MKNKRVTAFVLLLFVSAIWGIAAPVIKNTLSYFPPLIFLTYRFFLSALVALIYFAIFPKTIPKTHFEVKHTLIHGICVVVLGLSLLFFGFEYTDSLTGNLLAATGPVFSIALGALLLHEHVSKQELFGLLLAMFGSILTVLTGDGTQLIAGFLGVAIIGNALILTARIANAFGEVSIKQALTKGMQPTVITHSSFFLGFVVLLAVTFFYYQGVGDVVRVILVAPLPAHLGVWYMAFISGTLGYSLANIALKRIELGEASIFTYLTVIWGAPVSILWLGETPTPQFLFGAGVIALGVIIAEWHRKKRKKREKRQKK